jgi:7-cyano-7-deazaguanine reductase
MALKKLDNKNISKHLGKVSQYKSTYDASLLVREPRSSNRVHLNIKDDNLPFVGYDTWNAYEVSALTDSGLPVAGVAKIVYPASSKYIVESKSIKLYFNSFNMTKLGFHSDAVLDKIAITASEDLSKLLETDVQVYVHSNAEVLRQQSTAYTEWNHKKYSTIEDEYNVNDVTFEIYKETPELLQVVDSVNDTVHYHSALLKSNCRVTSQPDWGDVYITITKKDKTIDPISLLKYIISFRDECHFHEEICETIYKRIYDKLTPDELTVRCLYARRGGIDINPERANKEVLLSTNLQLNCIPHIKTPKQ